MTGCGAWRRIVSGTAFAAAAVAGLPLPAGALPGASVVKSEFATKVEGWSVAGDTTSVAATFVPTGGNPGGFAQTIDQAVGGIMYWVAPGKFRGERSAMYGGRLEYDLQQSATDSQFTADDIVLTGGGVTLTTSAGPAPGITWTHYSVPLVAGSGWKVGGVDATEAQVRAALADVTDLRIRAEYRDGADTDGLDNVLLVPGPQVSVKDVAGVETDAKSRVRFTVKLSDPSPTAIEVSYSVAPGTATDGTDYKARTGVLTFAPGQIKRSVSVVVLGDDLAEPTETFTLVVDSDDAGVTRPIGTATITDDDAGG
jgi:hypothetical protein